MAEPTEVARMVCSDCGANYFAEIVQCGGRWEIGQRVDAPPNPDSCRRQKMLCGDCRGKGGPGDQLQNLMRQQRSMMDDLGL